VIPLPYDSTLINLKIVEGRWLNSPVEPEIVMNQQAFEISKNADVGGYLDVTLGGKMFRVKLVGIAEELDKAKIYMDERLYDRYANPDHLVNSVMFIAKEGGYDNVILLKKEIERAIDTSDLNILYVMSQAERVKIIYDHLNIILTTIVFFALLVLVVSALGMASATSINIMERTREIGVLRAIGATPEKIYSLFIAEGMITSIVSILLGLILSWPLSIVASSFFGNLMLGEGATLQFAFSYSGCIITLVTTIAFGWLASRIPARNAIKVSTHEALSYV
jgi:putative ABC transport system permease protein